MKIVCISDTHNLHHQIKNIPNGDLLIHAGDLTRKGSLEDVKSFNSWLGELPHKYKVCISGNHDFCFEQRPEEARRLITNAHYLQDEEITIEGYKIYGSPWQPWFFDWAFNLRRGEPLREKWEKIPDDTDILITHGPPHGILDKVMMGERVGCEELLLRLGSLEKLKLHVFGHIHEASGVHEHQGIKMVNASTCTLSYKPTNEPVVVEL